MVSTDRQFSWRQGDVLTDKAVKELNLQDQDNTGEIFVVVVSHDCDLAAGIDKEPNCEVIIGKRIDKLKGDSYGKTARRLHIEYQTNDEPIRIELQAVTKQLIAKSKLISIYPRKDMWLDGQGIVILQRWLASRYHRAAFPEAFELRLRNAVTPGKKTFLKKLENILDVGGIHIRALLFDLDNGKNVERKGLEDVYELGIIVLYNSIEDESQASIAAEEAARKLEELFEVAFYSPGSGWLNINLQYCDPVSDNAITVAQREILKQWRLEHMSLQSTPPQPMITP